MQLLITLEDGSEIGVFTDDAKWAQVLRREGPGGCWGPPMPVKRAHEPNGVHVGEW
jgi:hypothetical protein